MSTAEPRHPVVLDLPEPTLQSASDVKIRMHTAALNHLDVWVMENAAGLPPIAERHVIGTDGAGVIVEAGADVTHVAVGDRVVINPGISCGSCDACRGGEEVFCRNFGVLGEHFPGTAAEYLVLPGRNVLRIEGDWRWDAAGAFTLSTLTAWRMLVTRAQLRAGETVLIWGIGGGVAIAALQIARRIGARVAVTSSAPEKLQRAEQMGAALMINHASIEDVAAKVKQHFGRGVDVVVDSVGEATWPRSLRALRPGGRLVTCGATSGPNVTLDLRRLFWFQWSLLGSTMGTMREFADVVHIGNSGALRPVVDSVFPLDRAVEAFRRLADGSQFGKIVLEVAQ